MTRKNRRDRPIEARSRPKHIPERSCLGCRSRRAPHELARLICNQYGVVQLDRSGSAPGRGAYICFDTACLRKALKLSRLAAAFRRPVVVPEFDTLYQAFDRWLCERLRSYFQLARKAGVLVSGYVSLHNALARAKVVCLVLAEDIAVSRANEYRSWCTQDNIPCITLFSKEELGQLIGRSDRSAVGLTESHFCKQIYTAVASLENLRSSKGLAETSSSFCQLSS
jgi:predicted RNA-binding protein YlxR (DUF448 family)/ribosomal protein L7Ae-like RNA K-turn-binding protein